MIFFCYEDVVLTRMPFVPTTVLGNLIMGGGIDWISEIEDIEAEVLWAGYLQSQ